ncbi:hypothetical protein FK216_01315 [Moraxellaceae bacterium AER2_44_116]|nr:hypothetical protein [Moraxellaceae bacterium]TQC99911.1 hypothetical protein FK216_01315 [Moraxellaceae bacterium AER2_44_116]
MYKKLLLVGYLTLVSQDGFADENDINDFRTPFGTGWQLEKEDRTRQISSHTRQEVGKRFRSFKGEVIVNASMKTMALILFNFDNYPKWFWQVREAHLLQKISPTEFIWYVEHDAPLNLPNRDAILHTVIDPATENKPYATLHINTVKNYLPERQGIVRIQEEELKVKLTPISASNIKIEIQGYVDPSGIVPVWATNLVQKSAPYASALGLKRMTNSPRFRDALEEPLFQLVRN